VRLHFLGTGTSFGVPVIGCSCATCRSPDPRDKRLRHAVLLEEEGRRLLVDTPPEIRLQLLRAEVPGIDAVWYTHHHADHVHGVDDLRVFSVRTGGPLPVYASAACAAVLSAKFDYVFDPAMKPTEGTTRPEAEISLLAPYEPVSVAGFDMLPLPVTHGPVDVYGFRVGGLGYVTDAKRIPERAREALAGVRVLVVNALWYGNPHPTHFNVEEAVEAAQAIGAERTYLTHLSHRVSHQELLDRLPPGIEPAYDGLSIDV
jgi:phosphoribosyl 1,2-cyclic phosphate phosphodiesterase